VEFVFPTVFSHPMADLFIAAFSWLFHAQWAASMAQFPPY